MLQQWQQPVPSPLMMQPASPPASPTTSLNPAQRRIQQMLSKYISAIRREDFLPRLNHVLHSRASSVRGSSADIHGYYASRPELRNYTLGVELDRDLDYTLILKNGQSVTDKAEIRSHFFGISRKNNNAEEPHEMKGGKTVVNTEELLVRAANQSLLADALMALQSGSEEVLMQHQNNEEGKQQLGLILPGPILSMTSVVERCHFTIDLQEGRVEAICVLAISVPDENRRLVLARAILIANFRPGAKKRQLQYVMQMVKAHHYPGSRTLRDAAISLARDQENLLFQSGHHEENSAAGTGNNNEAGQRRPFFLFRR